MRTCTLDRQIGQLGRVIRAPKYSELVWKTYMTRVSPTSDDVSEASKSFLAIHFVQTHLKAQDNLSG